jgi:hypothetical protein
LGVLGSFVREVEDAVSGGDEVNRVVALRKVTDLFVERADALSEGHVDIFDEVLVRLARNLEFRARIELSERLADIPNAPRGTVKDLAADSAIVVARPILERSSRLTEGELIELALRQSQDHLLAISRRSSLTENVTDILVERGNDKVVRSVAGNTEARFSTHGFNQLIEKARSDGELQALLRDRRDLPEAMMTALVQIAREHVRGKLQAEMGEGAGSLIEAAVARAASGQEEFGQGVALGDLERAAHHPDGPLLRGHRGGAWVSVRDLPLHLQRGPDARHRQDRHPRRHPAKTRQAYPGGAGPHAGAHADRREHPAGQRLAAHPGGRDHRRDPPRALGRRRLPARPQG